MKIPFLHRFFIAVTLVSITAMAAPLWGDTAQPIKVVCIGDSITQGRGDHSKRGEPWTPEEGWRYDFWKLAIDNNVPIQFVGTVTDGFESTPTYADYKGQTFNNLHEARWGWTTEGELNKLKETQSQWEADLALIYLGTNVEPLTDAEKVSDPNGIARTTAAMRGIVQLLQQKNPNITICIREILGENARSAGVNPGYAKLAAEMSTPTSKIVVVPLPADWHWDPKQPNTDTIDGCHSNKSGDQKIANGFWTAFSSLKK